MNECARQLCARLAAEAQNLSGCIDAAEAALRSGAADSLESAALFHALAADGVGHLQRLVLALSAIYAAPEGGKKGEEKGE